MNGRISCSLSIVALALLMAPAIAEAKAQSPIGVSPGGERTLSEVEQRCPTFSWGGDAATEAWELVVYRFEDGDALPGVVAEDARPVLAVELPGSARSWTPAVGQCLDAGGRYAWAVRSLGSGTLSADTTARGETSSWSEPRLFRISTAPTMAEVRDAMAVLAAYLGGDAIEVRTQVGESDASVAKADRSGAEQEDPADPGDTFSADEGVATLGGTAAIRATQTAVAGDASGIVGDTSSVDGAGGVFGNLAGGPDIVLDGAADGETDTTLSQAGIDRASGDPETFDIGNSGAGDMTLTVDGVEVVTTATDADTQYTAGNQLFLDGTDFNVEEGSGSGLDADLLDGLDSTDFTPAGTDVWVNTAGDTMTGTLTLNPAAGNAITTNDDIDLGTGSVRKSGSLFVHNQGNANTGLGVGALGLNTTGFDNTAVGYNALGVNTEGFANTAVGDTALAQNTTGQDNTALGRNALAANTTGSSNTAVGEGALFRNTVGITNTAVGRVALLNNTTGGRNVGVGYAALAQTTTAPWNTAVGSFTLTDNTIGHRNVAIGGVALRFNTEGYKNVAVGIDSMARNLVGNRNVAVGSEAMRYNLASDNTGVGYQALNANTTGTNNAALGLETLLSNTTGGFNVAVGANALQANTTGGSNTAVGASALFANIGGISNTAVGNNALLANTTGDLNVAVGVGSLYAMDSGGGNVALGASALKSNSTGILNLILGTYAGNLVDGSSNIILNSAGQVGDNNVLRIGEATGTGYQELDAAYIQGIYGKTSTGGLGVYINSDGLLGTTTSSRRFKEEIADLDEISAHLTDLRPVQFRFTEEAARGQRRPIEFGLIAEEVAEVMPELVVYDEEGQPFTVRYHLLTPLLLNEIQRQQRVIATMSRRLEAIERKSSDGP